MLTDIAYFPITNRCENGFPINIFAGLKIKRYNIVRPLVGSKIPECEFQVRSKWTRGQYQSQAFQHPPKFGYATKHNLRRRTWQVAPTNMVYFLKEITVHILFFYNTSHFSAIFHMLLMFYDLLKIKFPICKPRLYRSRILWRIVFQVAFKHTPGALLYTQSAYNSGDAKRILLALYIQRWSRSANAANASFLASVKIPLTFWNNHPYLSDKLLWPRHIYRGSVYVNDKGKSPGSLGVISEIYI